LPNGAGHFPRRLLLSCDNARTAARENVCRLSDKILPKPCRRKRLVKVNRR
jgi:hypothetical protein